MSAMMRLPWQRPLLSNAALTLYISDYSPGGSSVGAVCTDCRAVCIYSAVTRTLSPYSTMCKTNVSKTIRKPSLAKALTVLIKQNTAKTIFDMADEKFFHPTM